MAEHLTIEDTKLIIELSKGGMAVKEIAKKFECSESTIRTHTKISDRYLTLFAVKNDINSGMKTSDALIKNGISKGSYSKLNKIGLKKLKAECTH